MLTKEQIEEKNFRLYSQSKQSNTNPLGDRDDYIAIAMVGEAEYLVLIQYHTSDNEGYTKIRDFWNDPIYFPEFYFVGVVLNEAEFDKALAETGFEKFKEVDFNEIWQYK
jgi:uncharacterized protein YegJ (DUF2314 family)